MSIPTFNLYDFIHQVTEKQYMLKYFYPWGSRDINQVIDQLTGDDSVRKNQLHAIDDRLFGKGSVYFNWTHFQPVLFCHDQEPLNFEIYNNSELNLRQCKTGGGQVAISYPKKWILLHSEDNSKNLELYKQSKLFAPAHWWSHAIIARDWFRFAEYDKSLDEQFSKKRFLVYARAFEGSRQYRQDFLKIIPHESCQIGSFYSVDVTSESSAVYNVYDHTHTDISVVLETVVDRIHLTEKTCRAIACKHPFLLVAGAGSLDYLKKYGFRTFDPLIDESYDQQKDLKKRMDMIVEQMHRISNFNNAELKQLRLIAEYNHKRFFSIELFEQVTNELKQNVANADLYELDFKAMWKEFNKKPKTDLTRKNRRSYIIPLIWHLKKGGTLEDYVPPDLD